MGIPMEVSKAAFELIVGFLIGFLPIMAGAGLWWLFNRRETE